jgi:FixJ family two-component response regulator
MNFDDFKGHVYLIDDDPSIRRSLSFSLSSMRYSIQSFDNPITFLQNALPISPAVILLDMRMPGADGLSLQKKLRQKGSETPIVFISGESQPNEIIQALKNGANDFLLKPFGLATLIQAIDTAIQKDQQQLDLRNQRKQVLLRFYNLTAKEREICRWMVQGFGNKEIASMNGSAPSTVKLHRSRVLAKMECESLSELIELSLDHNRRILDIFATLPNEEEDTPPTPQQNKPNAPIDRPDHSPWQ